MAFRIRRRTTNFNIKRVISKTAVTIFLLYAGGYVINEIGKTVNGTSLPFNQGFTLIGWQVGNYPMWNSTHGWNSCTPSDYYLNATGTANNATWNHTITNGTNVGAQGANCVLDYTGTGLLTIIGIVGIASIILEFVKIEL